MPLLFAMPLVLLLRIGTAHADGIPAYVDRTGWHILEERAQSAVVAVRDGTEHLLLQIAVDQRLADEQVSGLVWVTPVPAPASTVHVDILRGFPRFRGKNPAAYVASNARGMLALMASSQIWPAPVVMLGFFLKAGKEPEEAAVVHERMVRDGVELELISAGTSAALGDHLIKRGVELPEPALRSLTTHADASGCFAVVRVVDLAAYRAATRGSSGLLSSLGIEVSFPARQGFFPLVASSALRGDRLQAVITVVGFARADEAPPGLTTEHFVGDLEASPEVRQLLGVGATTAMDPVRYTRFKVIGAPQTWQSDLRFGPGGPLLEEAAASWIASPNGAWIAWLLGFVVFVCISMLAAWGARPVWPFPGRPSRRETAAMGLANLLSLVGVLVAALEFARRKGMSSKRAIAFTAASSGIFCALLAVLAATTRLAR